MTARDRAVIVTGAAGGIGAATCDRLRQDGYWVVGTDRASPTGHHCDAFAVLDLDGVGRSDAAASVAAGELRQLAGARALHGIVHAAALQLVGAIESLSVEDMARTLAVNVLAPYALTRALALDLRSAKGSVVFITSIHAQLSKPGFALYATSKAAESGLARSLALELAPDVRVNSVSPAATDTAMLKDGFGAKWGDNVRVQLGRMHPLGRIAEPNEVAAVVAFMLSRDASFVSGSVVEVSGGIHARLHDVF